MFEQSHIRNFSIIAHIDHGKSTLADRLLELCDAVPQREMENQILDNMDLERERGITIKSRAVHLFYKAQDGEIYALNLIDTPGHVDFNYEVSRSLAACEGAVLVVDATQGVEAQTLANTYLAMEHELEILPVFNKIDLPAADPMKAKQEVEDIIGLPAMDAPEISAKLGLNVEAVLEDVVRNVPAPDGDPNAPLQALIFDSQYDPYVGVVVLFRIKQGTIRRGQTVRMMATGAQYTILECGYLKPLGNEPTDALQAGEVGYFTASIKNVKDTQVGDTVTDAANSAAEALPGYLSMTKGYDVTTGGAASFGGLSIISTLAWGLGYFGMPHILLRFMAIKEEKKLNDSRRIATVWVVISMFIAVAIGVIGYSVSVAGKVPFLTNSSDAETIIIKLADLMSQHGTLLAIAAGVILSGILAATMSTADSQLLTAASSVSQDLSQNVFGIKLSSKTEMIVARVTVLVVAAIGIILAWDPNSSVFRVVSFAWAGFGAAFGPVVLFSLFWKRMTRAGAIAGMLSGGGMVFIWKLVIKPLGGIFGIYELLPAFIVSSIFIIVVSLLTNAPSKEIQDEFERVKKGA